MKNIDFEELSLLIAECLIEPSYPEDVIKEAENIATRIIKRINLRETEIINKDIKFINGLNE